MPEISENTEVNEMSEVPEEIEEMDSDFEAEIDSKCEEYTSEGRSLEDIRRDKEELMQMREELLIKYKESQEAETSESDDEDGDPEKVLTLRRHR